MCCVFSTLSTVFWIYHTSPGVAYFLHFHLCFDYSYFPWCCVISTLSPVFRITDTSLVLQILYTFTCVLNYPYFPCCCVFSTLSPVFWMTHTSSSVVFPTLSIVLWIIPILPLVLRIPYTFNCVVNYPYFPWPVLRIVFISQEFWVTHTSSGVAILFPSLMLWFTHTACVWWSTHTCADLPILKYLPMFFKFSVQVNVT